MVQHVESFYGVYLLYNVNPKFKGRTYIGFTVDPNRRVKQHNTGKHAGGAWRTSGKGPWEMVLITHGFPNEISALRFEWAWQNPEKSRRLRHLSKKTRKETAYEYRLRILSEMLRTGPWHRLSLTVRWLIQSYQRDFPPDSTPPLHMAIAYGPVKAVKVKGAPSNRGKAKKTTDNTTEVDLTAVNQTDIGNGGELDIAAETISCSLCQSQCNSRDLARCYHPDCGLEVHLTCLSGHMLRNDAGGHVIPVSGACPRCGQELLWGDIIRHKQGCFLNLKADEELEENHWANELTS